eukprot:scaffold137187_cov45-Prasinocladus_malaysianus.AAC.2
MQRLTSSMMVRVVALTVVASRSNSLGCSVFDASSDEQLEEPDLRNLLVRHVAVGNSCCW